MTKPTADAVLGYNPINDRIMTLRLQAQPMNITLIQVYAPTSTASDADKDCFYQELQRTLDQTPKKDVVYAIGDWNAKVGKTTPGSAVGKFGLGVRNEEGERLVEFCEQNNLIIGNTLFDQPNRRLYTWTSPNGLHRNQIDYIIAPKRWRSSLKSAKTRPGADCGSDHELLVAKIKGKLRKTKHNTPPKRYDLQNISEQYRVKVSNQFQELAMEETEPEEMWDCIKSTIHQAAEEHVPKVPKKKKSHWLSSDSLKIAEDRKRAKERGDRDEARRLNRDFQRQARKDKAAFINHQCQLLEESNRTGNSAEIFATVRSLNGEFKPKLGAVKDPSGKVLTEEREVQDRWKQYTEGLYTRDPCMTEQCNLQFSCSEPDILKSEVEWALKTTACKKSPGYDDVPIELIQECGEEGVNIMWKLCNQVWISGVWPTDWKRSVFIPIPKKGDARECSNNRTIALISHASKVLLKIIQKRMEPYMERELSETQAGFRKGRGTRDQIANLRWIMETAREYQQELYMCFIDYSKAFDCVDHNKLWNILMEMGVPLHLVTLMKNLYTNQEAAVRTEFGLTDWFPIGKGVRQGCILSPNLFNMYSEFIMRKAITNSQIGVHIGGRIVNMLQYADDTTLITHSEEDLKLLLAQVKKVSGNHGLYLNLKKTKIMSNTGLESFTLDTEDVEVVDSFIFLGSTIHKDGGSDLEVRRRLSLGRAAMNKLTAIMKSHDISQRLKIMLVNSLVFPVVLYGAESWTLKLKEKRKLNAFEVWCWRRLLRIPWTQKATNEEVLNTIGHPTPLEALALKQKLSYFGHVTRHDAGIGKDLMFGKIEGSRRRGRQRTRWMQEITNSTGSNLATLKELTRDRICWRSVVLDVTRGRPRPDGH